MHFNINGNVNIKIVCNRQIRILTLQNQYLCFTVRHYKHNCSQPVLLWGSDNRRLCNMLCNSLSLHSHAAKLCNNTIALANFIKWHYLDTRWSASTYNETCSQNHGIALWWLHHFTSFPFSVAFTIPRSVSCGFLVLGIHQIQSLHMQSIFYVRFHKVCDCKHPPCYVAFNFKVRLLPHVMHNCLWWYSYGKCLILINVSVIGVLCLSYVVFPRAPWRTVFCMCITRSLWGI